MFYQYLYPICISLIGAGFILCIEETNTNKIDTDEIDTDEIDTEEIEKQKKQIENRILFELFRLCNILF